MNNAPMKKLIYLTTFLSVICLIAINANLPAFADLNGVSPELLGLIVSMNPLACLIFSVPFAYISDRHNRFIVIFFGLLLYTITALLLVLFKSVPALFVVKIFEGLAMASFIPATTAFITDISKKGSLSQNLGSFTAVFNLGFLVAPACSAAIGTIWNIEAIFIFVLIISVINLFLSIPMYLMYKKCKIEPGEVSIIKEYKKSDLKTFKWPIIISVALLSLTFGYTMGVYDTVWAYYIVDLGGTIFDINLTYFCYALPVVLLSKYMGKLADKHENLHLPIMLGSLIIALSILSFGFIPFPLIIAFVCAVEGVGNAAVFPCTNAAMVKSVDEHFNGRVLGLFNSARTAGVFIGAIATGYLFNYMTILPFIINCVIIIISAVIVTVCILKYKFLK